MMSGGRPQEVMRLTGSFVEAVADERLLPRRAKLLPESAADRGLRFPEVPLFVPVVAPSRAMGFPYLVNAA